MGKRGIFVTFEGTEGAGKSTLIRAVATQLKRLGHSTQLTREPGGVPLSEKIRKVILQNEMNAWTEVFLYQAARAEHVEKKILPALKRGKVVLCDRFTDSTLAYQSYTRGLPWKDLSALNTLATQGLRPDLTILLDIDPRKGLRRVTHMTRFEREGVRFQRNVRKGYLKARRQAPKRWLVLNMNQGLSPQALAQQVLRRIKGKQ